MQTEPLQIDMEVDGALMEVVVEYSMLCTVPVIDEVMDTEGAPMELDDADWQVLQARVRSMVTNNMIKEVA